MAIRPKGSLKKIEAYLGPDHIEFLQKEAMDYEDTLSYIYGALLDNGYDPDEVLSELGYLNIVK